MPYIDHYSFVRHPAFMQHEKRRFNSKATLAISLAAVLLLVELFKWDLVDWLSVFLFPLLLLLVWLLVGIALIWSLVSAAYRFRREGPRVLLVPTFLVATVLVAWFTPFTDIWLRANFQLKKAARERVITQVAQGELLPNVSYNPTLIALPEGLGVSKGGDEILIQGSPQKAYVFFFTFRGLLDNYAGFLWVPSGGKPELFEDLGEPSTWTESFGGNWYFVSHH